MTIPVATSITGWGAKRPLGLAVSDAVAASPSGIVQLAIGARPVKDPQQVLQAHPATFIAHNAVPLGESRMLRAGNDPGEMIEALTRANIKRYSAHPPTRKQADSEGMWNWAFRWWTSLRRAGISFAVETMYPVQDPKDSGWGAGWHLDNPCAVWEFCDRATKAGWEFPLVVDGAHLNIGLTCGLWKQEDIGLLVERCQKQFLCAEAHVSSNDGVKDKHDPPGTRPWVDEFVWDIARRVHPQIIVDEGRRDVV